MERITSLERKYVEEVLTQEFRTSSGGIMTRRLEEQFANRFNAKFAISFANGTATMHAALVAAGVGAGHEVVVPPLTMASTAFAVLQAGALPVFADVNPDHWTICPKSIKNCLTERTKAIIPVTLYGSPADMDPIMEIATSHNLFVLEDDAECFLGFYKGRVIGSIGHASSFSFQSSKHLTCGEGGMVTTNDEELANRIRRFGSLGYGAVSAKPGKSKITRDTIQDPNYLRHSTTGFNYRLSELCAAVALGQLERIDDLIETRINSAKVFSEALMGCDWLTPQLVPEGWVNSYWTYVVKLKNSAPCTWHQFRDAFKQKGGDGIYAAWGLTYMETAFRGKMLKPYQWQKLEKGLCPIAEGVQPKLLQFKTNYWDRSDAVRQADTLHKTINSL